MSDQHLKLTSHKIRHEPDAWFYEEATGICVVQQYRGNTGLIYGTRSVVIPWREIRAALKRKDLP